MYVVLNGTPWHLGHQTRSNFWLATYELVVFLSCMRSLYLVPNFCCFRMWLMLFLIMYLFSIEFPNTIYAPLQSSAFVESRASPIYWFFKFVPCVSRKIGSTSQLWSLFTSVKRFFSFENCIAWCRDSVFLKEDCCLTSLMTVDNLAKRRQTEVLFTVFSRKVAILFFYYFNHDKDNGSCESKWHSY